MATDAVAKVQTSAEIMERVVIGGDLSALKPTERVMYYRSVCESLGLNPLTKPFDYLTLNGKLVLYARKDCAEQLRRRDGVSITDLSTQQIGDMFVVTAKAQDRDSRTDSATGAVAIKGLVGDVLANAVMKAETKAKRRVTLSLCGLGILDETEIETVPDAHRVAVDPETGEIKGPPSEPPQPRQNPENVITEPQRRRLWAIAKEHGWDEETTRKLVKLYRYDSLKDIKAGDYDAIINDIKLGPAEALKNGTNDGGAA